MQAVFRRVFAHYDLAAEAYFRHLTLGGASGCTSSSAPGTISATLRCTFHLETSFHSLFVFRLLHLAVTHPLELHEVFQVIEHILIRQSHSS